MYDVARRLIWPVGVSHKYKSNKKNVYMKYAHW